MMENVICHRNEQDILAALRSLSGSGVRLLLDGRDETPEQLAKLLAADSKRVGICLWDESFQLLQLNYSHGSPRMPFCQ